MIKVAILDDYQNVSQEFVNLKKLSGKYEIKVLSEPFKNEEEAIENLQDYEALLIMRERTPITKNLINNLKKLKFIITSGMRNKAIDLEAAKKKRIIVCGTEINSNPTAELTWALILGLARNIKFEIDNMYHTDYWADGLIISTPTGSTGYSLSNGGPIVAPESGIIILNPISPHNINMRPFLIQDTSSIKIEVKEENYSLSLDSRIYSVDKKSILLLKKSDFSINTIEFAKDNFFKKLRDRLFWGQDMRNSKTIK